MELGRKIEGWREGGRESESERERKRERERGGKDWWEERRPCWEQLQTLVNNSIGFLVGVAATQLGEVVIANDVPPYPQPISLLQSLHHV